ncbi:ribonuclease P protein subunit p40-like [Anopheles maculipalpis]|uniref:ribonuclease P protein subunit p40-like n=1 Tax=Anopheles maculipalpis TaxID=1496333 RepID=UPI002158F693|nr:ribonuclease P protein subunit p40-like [Anopheles maculipalpis]
MLCPELWKFPTPSYTVERLVSTSNWEKLKKTHKIRKAIEAQQLNRIVSVVIPANEPQFIQGLEVDFSGPNCTLYRVRHFPVMEMLKREFMEGFVKRGTMYAISTNTNLETKNCAAITPSGELIMSIHRETLEKLEGNFTTSARSPNGNKCVIKIDLTSPDAKKQLKNTTLAFDLTLRWIPPGDEYSNSGTSGKVSASSIAKYLRDNCQLQVETVSAGCRKMVRSDESIPKTDHTDNLFTENSEQSLCTNDELLEYIGMLALDCKTTSDEYVSSYRIDEPDRKTETVSIFHGHGIITAEEIERCIMRVVTLLSECETIPWVGMHVQGFANVPLTSASRGEAGIYWNYDSGYTMVITSQKLLWSRCFGRRL